MAGKGERNGAFGADDRDDEVWRAPRRRWPWVVALVFALGAGVVVWQLAFVPRVFANRVLVHVSTKNSVGVRGEWWGAHGRASARFADIMAGTLRVAGLEAVVAGDPSTADRLEGVEDLEDLRAEARSLHAAWVLTGEIRTVRATPLRGGPYSDFAFEADLQLVDTEDEASPLPVTSTPVPYWQNGKDEDEALTEVCGALPKVLASPVALALAGHPKMRAAKERAADPRAPGGEELTKLYDVATRLQSAVELRLGQEEQMAVADAATERGPREKHAIGHVAAEEYLVGRGPGEGLVLMTKPRVVDYFAAGQSYRQRRGRERIVLTDADGGARRTVLEAFNFFSYPSVSADGAWVALVEDHAQWSKTLELVSVADGTVKELFRFAKEYPSTPEVAPDGRTVLFWYRECRECRSALDRVDSEGTKRDRVLAESDTFKGTPAWAPNGGRFYISLQPPGEPASVWQVEGDTPTALLGPAAAALGGALEAGGATSVAPAIPPPPAPTAPPAATPAPTDGVAPAPEAVDGAAPPADPPRRAQNGYDTPTVAPDGSFVVVIEHGGAKSWVGRLDLAGPRYRRLAELDAQRLAVSPDGQRVAVEVRRRGVVDDPGDGDTELAVLPASGGEPTYLTRNDKDDTLGVWSRDGARLYFMQGSRDPDGANWTNRVYWVAP